MRSRMVRVCSSVVALLAILVVSEFVGHWPARAIGVCPPALFAGHQGPSAQTATAEKIGDLPSFLDESDPWLHLQFIGEQMGWFAAGGKLWRTVDGGMTWLLLHDSSPKRIAEFQFVGPQMGWMIADRTMLKTNDGGLTWDSFSQPIPPSWEGDLINFKFLEDGVRGWVAGGLYVPLLQKDIDQRNFPPTRYSGLDLKHELRGAIFYTDDGGQTWRRQLLTSDWGYLSLASMNDPAHLSAVGTAGTFILHRGKWKPMDLGVLDEHEFTRVKSFDVEIGFPTFEPLCVFFLNDETGWISNTNGYLARSSDGGKEWQDVCSPIGEKHGRPISFSRLFFIDELNGLGFGSDWWSGGKLYVTKDGGRSWVEEKLDIELADIYFVDHLTIWASAKQGLFRIKL